jgi:hypothetical protein
MSSPDLSPTRAAHKAFVAHYQKLVVPLLRNHILGQARCVAAGVADFASAWSAAWHYAVSRGALHLAPAELEALEDWVTETLVTDVIDAECDGWGAWPRMGERTNGE